MTPASSFASDEFCAKVVEAVEGHVSFADPAQAGRLTDENGQWSNDALVEVVNDICALQLTPVTMVQ